MARPKFGPGDGILEIKHMLRQFIRYRKAWGPQECKMRLAAISALAYQGDIKLGPDFYALVRSISYRAGDFQLEEPANAEQRQPQSPVPAPEEKSLMPARTGSILDELDEQEKK